MQLVVEENVTETLESDNLILQNLSASKHVQVKGILCQNPARCCDAATRLLQSCTSCCKIPASVQRAQERLVT